jgi:F0F1-type ATP synthase membrane subunit c/vacuolar-type H+-ATPase subunit K
MEYLAPASPLSGHRPGIGIGILGGLASSPSGETPTSRGIAIILAAFAEGLGVLAIVVGLLAIFIQPAK